MRILQSTIKQYSFSIRKKNTYSEGGTFLRTKNIKKKIDDHYCFHSSLHSKSKKSSNITLSTLFSPSAIDLHSQQFSHI